LQRKHIKVSQAEIKRHPKHTPTKKEDTALYGSYMNIETFRGSDGNIHGARNEQDKSKYSPASCQIHICQPVDLPKVIEAERRHGK
jgi:hypothetical protein